MENFDKKVNALCVYAREQLARPCKEHEAELLAAVQEVEEMLIERSEAGIAGRAASEIKTEKDCLDLVQFVMFGKRP